MSQINVLNAQRICPDAVARDDNNWQLRAVYPADKILFTLESQGLGNQYSPLLATALPFFLTNLSRGATAGP